MNHVLTESKDRVLRVEIARPEKKNALTAAMYQALMRGRFRKRVTETMDEEGKVFSERLSSPEAREAMTAFFEKRKPDFSRF